MMTRWRAARLILPVLAVAGMVWANASSAEEPIAAPAASPVDLEQRVRELEEIVRQLKSGPATTPVAVQGEGEEGADPAAKGGAPLPPKDVQKLVDNYLKAKDTAAKKAEDQKKKEAAEKGFEVGSDLTLKATWKDGLNLETADKAFRVHVGGRAQADAGWFDPDNGMKRAFPVPPAGTNWQDGADLRRARLRVDGTCWEVVDWVFEYEFASGITNFPTPLVPAIPAGGAAVAAVNLGNNTVTHAAPTDVYADIKGMPIGTLRAGHFKVPFSLEDYGTSDSFLTFMERSTPNDAFTPNRKLGFMFYDAPFDQRMTWAVGAFKGSNDFGGSGNSFDYGDGEYLYAARITFNPWYEGEGRYWAHVGGAWLVRTLDPQDTSNNNNVNRARFASRAPIRVGSPTIIDTTALVASNYQELNAQAAINIGALSIQSEYYYVQTDDVVRGTLAPGRQRLRDPSFWGMYGQVSYFLTGDFHPYLRNIGGIGRVRPNDNFYWLKRGEHGCGNVFAKGAWEIAARYEILDLNSSSLGPIGAPGTPVTAVGTNFGIERDILFGVNWYLNPNFKFQWNYCRATRDVPINSGGVNGAVDILGMRLSWDF